MHYDHTLKKNFRGQTKWGNQVHNLCTNNYGFKINCKKEIKKLNKNIDIAFLGDSIVEGVGIDAENIFFQLISNEFPNKNFENFSVRSYSPIIFFSLINQLIKENFKFKEIFVFMDLSDLADDNLCYKLNNSKILRRDTFKNCYENLNEEKNNILNFYEDKFKFSSLMIKNFNKFLIKLNIKEGKIDKNILNYFRSSWTFNYEKKYYNNQSLEESIKSSTDAMNKLSKILKEKSISLNIVVFPHPATLYNDNENNIYVKTWKEFCLNNCKGFYDLNEVFFKEFENNFYKLYLNYFINGDIHLNKNGHKFVAKEFLKLYRKKLD